MKAMLINRVGDIGLLLAIFMIIKEFGTLEYSSIFYWWRPIEIIYLSIVIFGGGRKISSIRFSSA